MKNLTDFRKTVAVNWFGTAPDSARNCIGGELSATVNNNPIEYYTTLTVIFHPYYTNFKTQSIMPM